MYIISQLKISIHNKIHDIFVEHLKKFENNFDNAHYFPLMRNYTYLKYVGVIKNNLHWRWK
jgi:hypothetical protein